MKMPTDKIKRYVLPKLPYAFLFWLFDKFGEAYRTTQGSDTLKKLIGAVANLNVKLSYPVLSSDPSDIIAELAGVAAVYCTVLFRKKNAKKWRKGIEYGSARWCNKKDIEPYTDPKPENNIILTATESLTLNGRPKNPKHARNKNILIVGGSGSGKTRFWLKPNLMGRP